ncbi:hypothetical protein BOW37_12655 [Solemya velum gill symbiont]|nr:hypothetical protein BOW37_12655 [Solemya velum gill symbiont]OOZ43597.1 hypothetical protein BOW38_12340 [Solemya velum gill symbiont]OOZ48697.1 hypothetical protein BOW40_12485 [Solemya velum gill symbiont]OOZ52383.1 hypothetical protein BOW41_12525 [Solemya velum gill symbiont]OOZ53365.1 hypothetical protein BOW42_13160 [Solemya velum gill symbiont]
MSLNKTTLQTSTQVERKPLCSQEHKASLHGGKGTSQGASSSNTAPSNCISTPNTRILRVGIDSLYLSYPGNLDTETGIRLEALKHLARSKMPDQEKLAQLPIGDHLFQVLSRGRFPFEFILKDGWYRAEISGTQAERAPLAHVQIASEVLTFEGPDAAEQDLLGVISALGSIDARPNVSRADLCVDFVTDLSIDDIQEREWVSRARNFSQHSDKRRFSGWSIAVRSDLSARLYNKTIELEKSGKDYMRDIWSDLGWDGEQGVWRLEFQFRRDALRRQSVKTFDDLLQYLGGLWTYATTDWLRLTCPDSNDKTQTRWPTHPMWEVLQQADWGVEQGCHRQVTGSGQPPSDKYLFVNGLSGLTSYMAREGITDLAEAQIAYLKDAKDFHDERALMTGQLFEDYVFEKVALKARQYNSMKNKPPVGEQHPMDTAVSKEYKRRSNGG